MVVVGLRLQASLTPFRIHVFFFPQHSVHLKDKMKFLYAGNLGLEREYPQLEAQGGLNSCNKLGLKLLKIL